MHMAMEVHSYFEKVIYLVFIGSLVFSTHLSIYRTQKLVLYTSYVDVLCEVVES